MRIYELAEEYDDAADVLRGRIRQLEEERGQTEDEARQFQLDVRLRPLRAMYRETRSVARHLERYYARFDPERRRNGK